MIWDGSERPSTNPTNPPSEGHATSSDATTADAAGNNTYANTYANTSNTSSCNTSSCNTSSCNANTYDTHAVTDLSTDCSGCSSRKSGGYCRTPRPYPRACTGGRISLGQRHDHD